MRTRVVRIVGSPLTVAHAETPADALVVLGSRLQRDGSLTRIGEERIRAGVSTWQRGLAPILVLTGGRDPLAEAALTEAEALARRARALGVADSALVLERESSNTADNARFTARLLLPSRRTRVRVVTQPFHLRRALFWFRRAGFEAWGHHIEDSLQYREPALGAKWIAQEYVSWAKLWLLEAVLHAQRR